MAGLGIQEPEHLGPALLPSQAASRELGGAENRTAHLAACGCHSASLEALQRAVQRAPVKRFLCVLPGDGFRREGSGEVRNGAFSSLCLVSVFTLTSTRERTSTLGIQMMSFSSEIVLMDLSSLTTKVESLFSI